MSVVAEPAMQVRAAAARQLIAAGEVSPDLALSLVVWPTQRLAEVRTAERPPEARETALELVAAGASWAQAAREVGVHKQTVGGWVKARRVAA